ncbi:hypothetical protein QBC44DRAFT_292940 [Cladorrhinum sp. PSN332]|nr:hypothetical protein QBC44DRAFT_292940 [Cladorrhinum sp. PSN332]
MVSLRTLVTSAVAFMAAPSLAALTPAQIIDGINALTTKSRALQTPAQSITLVNSPLIVIGQGPFPKLIVGFTDIVTTATVVINQSPGTPKITSATDAAAVADSFRNFVIVHQKLLNILIGKSGLLTQLPFVGPPVAAVLRQVEAVVDTIAFSLLDLIEDSASKTSLARDHAALANTIETAIEKYSGLAGGINVKAKRDASSVEAKVFVA